MKPSGDRGRKEATSSLSIRRDAPLGADLDAAGLLDDPPCSSVG